MLVVHHGRNADGLQARGPVHAGGGAVQLLVLGQSLTFLALARGDVVKDQPGQQEKQHHIEPAHHFVHGAQALQPHDHLRAQFHAEDGSYQHGQAQGIVHIAELAVPHGGDERFARHLRHVRTNGKCHGKAQNVQAGRNHPRAAHAEEPADDPHAQAQNDQSRPEDVHAGNGHQHIQPVHMRLLPATFPPVRGA